MASPHVFCAHTLSNRVPLRESDHLLFFTQSSSVAGNPSADTYNARVGVALEPEEPLVAKGTLRAVAPAQPLMLPSRVSPPVPPTCRRSCAWDKGTFLRRHREEGRSSGGNPTAETGTRVPPFLSLSAPWPWDWRRRSGISTPTLLFVSLHHHLSALLGTRSFYRACSAVEPAAGSSSSKSSRYLFAAISTRVARGHPLPVRFRITLNCYPYFLIQVSYYLSFVRDGKKN